MKILIMAGGTGGHVFPALAIAQQLKKKGIEVAWLGTHEGIEATLVPKASIPLYFISIAGFRGKSFLKKLMAPFKIIYSLVQSIQLLRHLQVDKVLGLGGYASGPGGMAAVLLKIPLFIHEQNAIPGTTNKILAHFAKQIMQAFPHTFPEKYHPILTGNPIREDILQLPPPKIRFQHRTGPLRILVLGGSRGAQAINETFPKLASLLPSGFCEIVHQTGSKHFEITKKNYGGIMAVKLEAFIEDMAAHLAWADIVVCRSGALTVSELAAVGVASILIPFPFAIDDHQTANAAYLVDKGAGILLPQSQLNAKILAELITSFSRENALEKAKRAFALRLPEASESVVNTLLKGAFEN
ncbi:MAG: undecaprenyldiphospho-muramoylpentapeptide beta-N-acetylglucosaminyltransferase [Gammaproteobacteria bacterium RIFCSPLOWO2_02_FULL_38_11]|nr:MAG: undecaprenyldiphospho-muramoylpentapeptide beta-N-acetylglucosaminyltransferase [Gammaproteobacteria bacterium RIFCSPHIGHO2_02_FULL_38_33]OGT23855.1 MAG: undecaprenyldiphospho-muramoylpentapeptide beta-N-acetylglucosaminyltransferase [Gammaproteobacteria bacterium RIFCSPHIGHO2_12_38_15]OGT69137.1 MAG: undecaprenyldiphospho-muramoylpentapeptide beta-N-acetylglucosaminyltransferase [Gammaproteobacteria bacterium RIFCSPLOWO2_02_FULL_38_11]OGT77733.1 MAG: undecaprenyldiphospho-muramoylpentap